MDNFANQLINAGIVTGLASNATRIMEAGNSQAEIQLAMLDAKTTGNKAYAKGYTESKENAELQEQLGKAQAILDSIGGQIAQVTAQGVMKAVGL